MKNCGKSKGCTSKITRISSVECPIVPKIVSQYDQKIRQTNQQHPEEEPHNNHETPGRQTKQNNQLSVIKINAKTQQVYQMIQCIIQQTSFDMNNDENMSN